MKFFMDCEFIEDGKTIDLISIGIACDDGRTLYLQSCEFDPRKASPWVEEHVFPGLQPCPYIGHHTLPKVLRRHRRGQCTDPHRGLLRRCPWRTRAQIADEVRDFMDFRSFGERKPRIITWCGSYDHVALCQLYGPMISAPRRWPHHVIDIQVLLDARRISDTELPTQEGAAHHALSDARYLKTIWEFLHTPTEDVPLSVDDNYPIK